MYEKTNVRARVKELLEKKENSDFFKSLYESGSGLTPAQNITAPEDIEELIRELVYEKSKVYKYLDVRRFSGDETVYVSKNAYRYGYKVLGRKAFGFRDECFDYEGQRHSNKFENSVVKIHLQSKKIMLTTSICNALLEGNSYLEVAIEMINNISTIMAFVIDRNVIFGLDKWGLDGAFDHAFGYYAFSREKPEDYNLNYIIELANSFYELHKRMPIIIMDTRFFMGLKLKTKIKGFVKTADEQKEIELFEEKNVLDLDGITFNNGDVILPNGIRIIVLDYDRYNGRKEDWRILLFGDLYNYVLGERKGIEFSKDESNSFNLDETSFRVKFRADGREDTYSNSVGSIAYKFDI